MVVMWWAHNEAAFSLSVLMEARPDEIEGLAQLRRLRRLDAASIPPNAVSWWGLGPSGCGKTTLPRLIAGLQPSEAVDCRQEVANSQRSLAPNGAGMVFQTMRCSSPQRLAEHLLGLRPGQDTSRASWLPSCWAGAVQVALSP